MIYRYEVTVPLIYNRHELYTRNPDMEQRFEFDAPLTYKFKVRFVTFELSGMEE